MADQILHLAAPFLNQNRNNEVNRLRVCVCVCVCVCMHVPAYYGMLS